MQVVRESMLIRQQVQLFLWLQGDLQAFLPHETLLIAYGDLEHRKLRYEVISATPEVRGPALDHLVVEDMVSTLFDRWVSHGRTGYYLGNVNGVIPSSNCQCELHRVMRKMKSVMVQGLRDERAGVDVLYAIFQRQDQCDERSRRMFEILLPHIDFATRRVGDLSGAASHVTVEGHDRPLERAGLTAREMEIIEWVRNGKTNYEIGIILNISAFTVKNHLQRIFRKIDVTNRAQAVYRIEELTRMVH